MSKNIVLMLLCVLLTATIASAIVPVSVRMRGLGPSLVGIVDDEYSDLFFNPAFINKIDGNRVYTNLSNVHNFGEDLIFSDMYSPDMYYNLLGGITECCQSKVGALIEMSGADMLITEEEYTQEIDGNDTYIDSIKTETKMKYTDNSFNLFLGKKFGNFHIGVWVGPEMMAMEQNEKDIEKNYHFRNDSLIGYNFSQEEMNNQAKTNAYPFMIGAITGEPENEISVNFAYGFDRVNGIAPVNFITSELNHELDSTLTSIDRSFDNTEEKTEQSGYFLAFNGRNKRRFEDHSLVYLAGLTYSNRPNTYNSFDTTCDFYSPSSGYHQLTSTTTTQEGEGPTKYIALALGIGTEKYFDALNTNSLFAIGFIPSYFGGSTTITMRPEQTHIYAYDNYYYSDTLEYTVDETSNETTEIKNTFGGFTFTIPAGLETNLTNRLVLRLGVTQDIMLKVKDCTEQTLTDGGWTEHYVSGSFDTTYAEPADELDSHYTKIESKTSIANSTTYHYGLGFKVNDNIELNFLNYSDLTNLMNWVLGVNIKW